MPSSYLLRLVAVLPLAAALANPVSASAVAWRTNLDAAKIEATQSGKLLLLHFYTDTCGPCKVLEKQVFNQPHIGAALEKSFVPVKVNASHSPALAGMFRVERWPTDVILSPQGSMLAKFGCPNKPDPYLAQLSNLANHYQQTVASSRTVDAPQRSNAAYAGLDAQLPPSAAAVSNRLALTQAAENAASPSSRQATSAQPQITANPYVAAPTTGTDYRAQTTQTSTPTIPSATTPVAVQTINRNAVAQTTAPSGGPTMPANAMPQSYRYQPTPPAAEAATNVAGTPMTQAAGPAPITPTPITPTPMRQTVDQSVTPVAGQVAAKTDPVDAVATQVPAGSPPLGFDGCCPVTLKFANKWVQGRVNVGMEHRGRLYLFAGEKERQQFAANPDAYSPVFGGLDPVLMLDENRAVTGHRRFGFRYQGQFYLFSTAETKEQFAQAPSKYAMGVRQAMHRIDASDTGIIRR